MLLAKLVILVGQCGKSAKMLTELVNESSFEFSILIKDSIEKRGFCLIQALLKQASNRKKRQILCVNTEPEFISTDYRLANVATINVFGRYEEILDLVLSTKSTPDCCVVFTSLSLFLMNYSQSKFSQLMRSLRDSGSVTSVIALIHTDVLASEETLVLTEYLFDAVVSVIPAESELAPSYYGNAKCLRRRANGKLESSDEYFSLKDNDLDLVHASTSAAIKSLTEADGGSADITSSLTFNLSLSDKERKAKNMLQLPYLKKDAEKQALLSQTHSSGAPLVKIGPAGPVNSGGGKIYYHYDEADDFDEEDPDDDLDI